MQALLKRNIQKAIDKVMPLYASLPLKGIGHNYKFKMSLPAPIIPGMAFMLRAFIDNLQMAYLQAIFEFFLDKIFHSHSFNGYLAVKALPYNNRPDVTIPCPEYF